MKHILTAPLFLLAISAFGQRYITQDTTYQTNANGNFYSVREVKYNTGEGSIVTSLLGDTSTVFEGYYGELNQKGVALANQAREVARFDKEITTMIQQANALFASIGRDVLDTLAKRHAAPLLTAGWIIQGTAAADISFSINANGQLRYQVTGFQARNAFIFANTMRLNNYLNGEHLNLYKNTGGNWFSADNKIKLKFPGNPDQSANRAAIPKDDTPAPKPNPGKKKPVKKKKQ